MKITARLPRALADRRLVAQILTNLMVNAIQAMPRGGALTVSLTRGPLPAGVTAPESSGAYWCLAVRDEGEGISASDLPHIFEPFYTTKGIGEGTGLGLSVAYGIVQEHGGVLCATGQPQRGSTFCVYLPVGASA